jgi:hypothetical protein
MQQKGGRNSFIILSKFICGGGEYGVLQVRHPVASSYLPVVTESDRSLMIAHFRFLLNITYMIRYTSAINLPLVALCKFLNL